jgi:DNA excision repair protein ERCC-4
MYEGSVEERRYEGALRRERRAFEQLIQHKAHMVIPKDAPPPLNPGDRGGDRDREREREINPYTQTQTDTRDTRPGGGGGGGGRAARGVIVDVREFRSALPFTLYSAGLKVIPVTLQV